MKSVTIVKTEYSTDKEVLATYVFQVNKYDEKERVTEETELDEDGKVLRKVTYEYSAKGNLSVQSEYDESGALVQKFVYEENEEGEIVKQSHVYADGSETIKSYTFKSTDSGEVTEILITDEKGNIEGRELLKLDKNDNVILVAQLDEEGNENIRVERVYNEKNILLEEKEFSYGEADGMKRYSYNDKNDILQVEFVDDAGNVIATEKYKYDDNGNLLDNKIENRIEKYTVQKEFQWDDKGNITLTLMYRDGRLLYQSKNEYGQTNELLSEDILEMEWSTGKVGRHEKLEYKYEN